jgi:hypothetical protein
MLVMLSDMDFKIKTENGICNFEIIPKNPNISAVLFYNPVCPACVAFLNGKKNETLFAINVLDSPMLSTHFNIAMVPWSINF